METDHNREKNINEITNFVMTSTDIDHLILSAFISGMQVGRSQELKAKEKVTSKSDY